MLKRVFALLLSVCVLFAPAPAAFGAESGRESELAEETPFRNSDREAALDGTCWYVDTMNGDLLTASRLREPAVSCTGSYDGGFEIEVLTDWPADQLLYWQGRLLVSAGERLLTLEPESGRILETRRFDAPVERFAVSEAGLWVLTGGRVLRIAEKEECVISGGVTGFWLEDAGRLSYMRDQESIHTMDLSTGLVTDRPNEASDLGDVPLWQGENAAQGMGYSGLKEKFPSGKYWNHMPNRGSGMSYNNQDGWTEIPCTKHNNYCGTYLQTCNGYAPNGRELSYQCWGFADKLGYDATGLDPQTQEEGGWQKLWYKSSLDSLKAGDIIRYNKNGSSAYAHSIYVTAVSGDTITFADCNYDGTCVIRWDQTISRSTVKYWFVFLLKAPAALTVEPTFLLSVNACLDGELTDQLAGAVSFDVWKNGAAYKTGVSRFREYLVKGTAYELRNVTPVEGILFDQTAAELSGALTGDKTVTLTLDHYYLNSAEQPVKTTLRDLPDRESWSYRPICWALENNIAKGVTATEFRPKETCTRAQAVTFLWAAAGRPEPSASELPFLDVPPDSYYCRALLWALERGITAGISSDRFGPEELCTRAQVVTFLWSAAGKPAPTLPEAGTEPFKDVPADAYYRPSVLWAVQQGIAKGTGAGTFSPNEPCTRDQILTFLYAASQIR